MIAKKKSSIPLLTVLMPIYNAEKFLAESINSILSQTYKKNFVKNCLFWRFLIN